MSKNYIIKGPNVEGEQLYWSNEGGWWDRSEATVFSDNENINLPVGASGKEYLSPVRKTFITFAVLHRDDATISEMGLSEILEECDTGDMIRSSAAVNTNEFNLTEGELRQELLNIGNDGDFFNDRW